MKKTVLFLSIASASILTGCVHQPSQTTATSEVYALPEQPDLKPNTITTLQNNAEKKGYTLTELVDKPIPQERIVSPNIYELSPSAPEVVRYDRYLLVGSSPQDGQKYLLDQLISVKVPQKNKKSFNATVENGLNAALLHTGFTLCHPGFEQDVRTLFSRQLPRIHYQFGPMMLRDALQMLAGPAFNVTVNDITRTICFSSKPVSQHPIVPITVTTTTTTTEVINAEE